MLLFLMANLIKNLGEKISIGRVRIIWGRKKDYQSSCCRRFGIARREV